MRTDNIRRDIKKMKEALPSNEPIAIIVDLSKGETIPENLPRDTIIIVDDIE